MKCSVCNTLNKDDALFCRQCGSRLHGDECPKCKASAEPGARFCSVCGHKLVHGEDEGGRTCQSCGFTNPAETLYCKRCNQKIL